MSQAGATFLFICFTFCKNQIEGFSSPSGLSYSYSDERYDKYIEAYLFSSPSGLSYSYSDKDILVDVLRLVFSSPSGLSYSYSKICDLRQRWNHCSRPLRGFHILIRFNIFWSIYIHFYRSRPLRGFHILIQWKKKQ